MSFQGDSIFWVEVEKIVPNPFQPRREFDEAKLKELAESVRMYGILQPLTVTRREVPNEDGSFRTEYELIAGERRLRASKLAGLAQVPVIIRDGEQSEQEKLELAIIENLQREDLNAVDRALAFRQLADVFDMSHAQVAKKVGRSREYVSNSIRILALPDYMLDAVRTNDISEGHARTLLMLNDRPEEQDTVFRETLLKKLSVREVERIARGIATEKVRKKESIDSDLLDLEKQFTETLGTRVSIVKTEFGGRLTIDYFSPDELQVMLTRMRDEQVAESEGGSVAAEVASLAASTPLQATSESEYSVFETAEVPEVMPESAPNNDEYKKSEVMSRSVSNTESPAALPIKEGVYEDPVSSPTAHQVPSVEPQPPTSVLKKEGSAAVEEKSVENNIWKSTLVAKQPETSLPPVIAPSIPEASGVIALSASESSPTILGEAPVQSLSLRDQLALMLQKKQSAKPAESLLVTPAPTTQSPPSDTVNQPPAASAPKVDDDDSNLYSMKNFTL